MVEVKVVPFEEELTKGGALSQMREVALNNGFKNPIILEELAVKDPKNFGKGYGKKAFLDLLKNTSSSIIICPFSVFYPNEDNAYAGRIKMDNIDNMEKGVEDLKNKFYIPLIKKAGRKCKILKTEFHEIIVVE